MLKIFRGFNPWVVVFVGTAIFHIWRGSGIDAVIFAVSAVILISQVLGLTKLGFRYQRQIHPWPIAVVIVAVGLGLFFAERASIITAGILVAVFFGMFPLIFYKDLIYQPKPTVPVLRARLVWSLWALSFTLIELSAFVASQRNGGDENYPTISLLLDQPLNEPVFRAAFVIAWLMLGVFLFGVRRR